jgi:archaemetzincin
MLRLNLLPIGEVNRSDLHILADKLRTILNEEVRIHIVAPAPIPAEAFNDKRNQYDGAYFLDCARAHVSESNEKVLGITTVDLYTPTLNFIFGQAEIGGCVAVISLHRLSWSVGRQEFISRMTKEAVHELGHVFGLHHCADRRCVMRFSNCLADTDYKSERFCERCMKKLKKL